MTWREWCGMKSGRSGVVRRNSLYGEEGVAKGNVRGRSGVARGRGGFPGGGSTKKYC